MRQSTTVSPQCLLTESQSIDPPSLSTRVCDSCIRKKVKCDLGRPTCSRCFERGYTCTYSFKRRKPGPTRGSSRRTFPSKPPRSYDQQRSSVGSPISTEGPRTPESISAVANFVAHESTASERSQPYEDGASSYQSLTECDISPQQEEHLIEQYFELVNGAIPIFSRARFFHRYRNSMCSPDLILTMITITAKLTGFVFPTDSFDLDARIDWLLSSGSVEEDLLGDFPSLDQIRKACLLAFYEFHQFPGHQSWMRIGKLTRMAYRIGLDQIENPQACFFDSGTISEEDLEEWRFLWWCIYCLDSYSNIGSGTPCLVEAECVHTALVRDHLDHLPVSQGGSQKVFLHSESDSLWKLLPTVTSDPRTMIFNIHIITTTALRQAGQVLRLRGLRPPEEAVVRLTKVERHLTSLRLALPANYLNPKRNTFWDESSSDHHARLITVLHLHMARMLISLLNCFQAGEAEWLLDWQQVLESCQDIALIAEQWNSSYCMKVDPAISLIIFTTLIFLDLHKKSITIPTSTLYSKLEHYETVLLLQLEQFAQIWTLPKLLTLSFKSFTQSVSGPLSYHHIQLIFSRYAAPLHPRWLQFLSSAQAVQHLDTGHGIVA